ncbi:glycosyltransferase family 2 protein [Saliphagus infecundisoli]|uniref:Glycosyltransferase family 2 protein n=1 Tax=Saliphagus infecundisoli TaxID=1849069 RepID=A0ABD5QGR8_9EURY|nr:glycosyltransferase [Saliphagus infecundisoli]
MVVGLSTLISAYGKLFRSRRSFPASGERPTVTAMIPALNEERTIPYALASLAAQTVPPDRVVVVDDGSTDDTTEIVAELATEFDLEIVHRRHEVPQGKTVGMKEVARESETDTVFVLDADTFLESPDYVERLLEPHADPGVASSFGTVYPTSPRAKRQFYHEQVVDSLPEGSVAHEHVRADLAEHASRTGVEGYLANNEAIIGFRNVDYHVQQRVFADGIMRAFGSTLFPVGAAVLYDRERLVSVFDDYEESLGDDLTNSEDIFLGFAFSERGWANVHLHDTYLRSDVPGLRKTFKQNYLWGSGYLQSAFYFTNLTFRFRTHSVPADEESGVTTDGGTDRGTSVSASVVASPEGAEPADERADPETDPPEGAGSEPESDRNPPALKRPMGRLIIAQVLDGLYPTTVFVMLALSGLGFVAIDAVMILIVLEYLLSVGLAVITRTRRVTLLRGLVPFVLIRTVVLPVLTYTYLRVGTDILLGNRDWRK